MEKRPPLHWINIIFFFGTLIAALVCSPLYFYYVGAGYLLVSFMFVYAAVTAMSITGGYHRYLAHRSYDASRLLKFGFLLFGAGAFQGSALQWSSDHRRHHRHADTEKDHHNINKGFLWAHIGWILHREDPEVTTQYPPDLANDRLLQWQHRNYVWIAILMCFGVPFLFGCLIGAPIGWLFIGGLLRVVLTSHSTFLINSYAHTFGRRPYSDEQTARDSIFLAFMAFGEGYHNYHHQFPSDYRNGIRWYQWDPTKWMIRFFSWFKLAKRLKRIPKSEIFQAKLRMKEKMRGEKVPAYS